MRPDAIDDILDLQGIARRDGGQLLLVWQDGAWSVSVRGSHIRQMAVSPNLPDALREVLEAVR